MTHTYDSLGLCRHWGGSTPGSVLKWHNRALLKDNFVSEWQAIEAERTSVTPILTAFQVPEDRLCFLVLKFIMDKEA
jgi:hypothetical protein